MKKLLILSATADAGHTRAADALAKTVQSLRLPVKIEHRDILDFTFPLFKKVYSEINNAIAGHTPELWGYLYKKSQFKGFPKPKNSFLKVFDQFNYKKYLDYLNDYAPDAVICTHFLPYIAITDELAKPSWQFPFYTVPTDYDVHSLWIHPSVKRYYVATEEAAWTVCSYGIEEKAVMVTGIPVHPAFTSIEPKASTRKELNLDPKPFTILILSGGYGIGVIDTLVPSVIEFLSTFKRRKFNVLVICGKNKRLHDILSRISSPENVNVSIFGFISNVDQLMDASDVLITKSGGLTVSEALSKHLPMIIFDAVPGQEGRNADYLVEHGAAIKAANFTNLNFKLKYLANDSASRKAMSDSALKIAKPNAAMKILKDILNPI